MFLSIIIPTYNAEKYIADCLDSCLKQNIPYDDYEIICADDGSSDKTPDIIQQYAEKYPNITVILNEHGVSGRNSGYEIAKGDYLWFVDNDDFVKADCLEFMKETLRENDCERLVFSCYDIYDEPTDEEYEIIFNDRKITKQNRIKRNTELVDAVVWTSIIKTSFLRKNNIYPRDRRFDGIHCYSTDSFFIYVCKKNDVKEKYILDKPFYFRRLNVNSMTGNTSAAATKVKFDRIYNLLVALKEDYDIEKANPTSKHEFTFGTMMGTYRETIGFLTILSTKDFFSGISKLKKGGLFPMISAKEYGFTFSDYLKMELDIGFIRRFALYHSNNIAGLMLLRILCYRTFIARALSKNKLFNKIINDIRKWKRRNI